MPATANSPCFSPAPQRPGGFAWLAVAVKGETLSEIDSLADEVTWIQLGQLGKLIKAFKRAGVDRAAMCGGVKKTRMFKDVRPDLKAVTLVGKLRHMADDGILRTLAAVLEDEGIQILPSHELVPNLLAEEGVYTGRGPSAEEQEDIEVGWELCGQLGKLDIGQCLVIRQKSVVAVEAMEGTDACIRRGGELAGPGTVVIKRCKPIQDRRFDLPAVGRKTIESMAEAKASCLVIEAGRSLVFDKKAMADLAGAHDICIVARKGDDPHGFGNNKSRRDRRGLSGAVSRRKAFAHERRGTGGRGGRGPQARRSDRRQAGGEGLWRPRRTHGQDRRGRRW